jgi:hypothetical protein
VIQMPECRIRRRRGMHRGRTPAHAWERCTTLKEEDMSSHACFGRPGEGVRIIRCGGMRSGSRTRRDRIRCRTIFRRLTSSGGLRSQGGLANMREADQGHGECGGVGTLHKQSVAFSQKSVYHNALESRKHFDFMSSFSHSHHSTRSARPPQPC